MNANAKIEQLLATVRSQHLECLVLREMISDKPKPFHEVLFHDAMKILGVLLNLELIVQNDIFNILEKIEKSERKNVVEKEIKKEYDSFLVSDDKHADKDQSILYDNSKHFMASDEYYDEDMEYKEEEPDSKPLTEADFDWPCSVCGRVLSSEDALLAHHTSAHANQPKLKRSMRKCGICGNEYKSSRKLKAHRERAHDGMMAVCSVCGDGFERTKELRDHVQRAHGEKQAFSCEFCEKTFTKKSHLVRHIRVKHETKGRPHSCEFCEKTFIDKSHMAYHIKSKHAGTPKNFVCNYEIKEGDSTNENDTTADDNGNEANGNDSKDTEAKNAESNAAKKFCNKAFYTPQALKDHIRTHTGEKPFTCDQCGYRCALKGNLYHHIKWVHKREKNCVCPICNKAFKRQREVRCHMNSKHTGQRPFVCEICGATFARDSNYLSHKSVHTGVRPYVCEVCNKDFRVPDARNLHRFVHVDKQRYECATCSASFMRKPMLLSHVRTYGHHDAAGTAMLVHNEVKWEADKGFIVNARHEKVNVLDGGAIEPFFRTQGQEVLQTSPEKSDEQPVQT